MPLNVDIDYSPIRRLTGSNYPKGVSKFEFNFYQGRLGDDVRTCFG